MIYADYYYYKNQYGGALCEKDYNKYASSASSYIDYVTVGRARMNVDEDVKNACCAVADAYALNEKGGGIASETVGNWSVSYVSGVSNAKTDDRRLYDAAKMYLVYTGLMFRGF